MTSSFDDMPCQECKGMGRLVAEYIDGYARHEPCDWCGATGKVSSTVRGKWLSWRKQLKSERKAKLACTMIT